MISVQASLLARILSRILRLTGTYRKRYSGGPEFKKLIDRVRALKLDSPTKAQMKRLDITQSDFQGHAVWTVAPKYGVASAHMLFFHGGGYVFSAVPPHFQTWANLAETYGIKVTAPLYPLAPEACAEETTRFALDFYRDYVASHEEAFVMAGDSAGGGLASVVAQAARDEGLRAAAGLVLVCPWLDCSVTHPDQPAIEPRDCILMVAGAQQAGALYARNLPVADKRVSPINGDWSALPPILCFSGSDDILSVDSKALQAKLPDITHVLGEGLMHDWPLFLLLREGKEAQARIADFVRAKAG